MSEKIINNATDSVAGIIYQFYVALDYCNNLVSGEKLWIEKFGDITISNTVQIEIKHFSNDLTDLHENIWKTLHNWLNNGFKVLDYKQLILLTTQNFSNGSTLREWNDKTVDEKLNLLKDIQKKYQKRVKKDKYKEKLVMEVMNTNNETKLKMILKNFIILDSSSRGNDYYCKLKDKHAGHIPISCRDNYINSLFGFIVMPAKKDTHEWEITYENFSNKKIELTEQLTINTRIFPSVNENINGIDFENARKKLFVKKIEEIAYSDVIPDAIKDYLSASHFILQDFCSYSASKEIYYKYLNELEDTHKPKFRIFCNEIDNSSDVNRISQKFYDELTGESVQPFYNFNNTPRKFRNGCYHLLCDDEKKNIKWKLNT